MLQALREKAQGWIAWVIVLLIGITFVLFWGGGSFLDPTRSLSKPIATVNGEKITQLEIDKQYEQMMRQPNSNTGRLAPELVKAKILDELIEEKLLKQGSENLGFRISPHRVDATIQSLPIFQENGLFSIENYKRFLMSNNMTDKELKGYFTQQLLQRQLYSALADTSFLVEPDIDAFLSFYYQKRSFKQTTIPRKPFADKIKISDQEIQTYYDENQKEFYDPEKVAVEYVVLDFEDLKNSYKPTEDEIKAYYDENAKLFNVPERRRLAHIYLQVSKNQSEDEKKALKAKIDDIYKKLKAGEQSFEELAKQFSDDNETKDKGGELEWIVKGEIGIPEFENVAFNLEKYGYSEPVLTDYGFHIIKLLDVKPEKVQSLAQVKSKVISQLQNRWAEDELINRVDKLTNLSYDYPDTLQPIVDEMQLELVKTEKFSMEAPLKDKLLNRSEVIDAAFSEYVKRDGNNSDVIRLDDLNAYIVLRVAEVVEPKLKSLEEVKNNINSLLVFEQSNKQAEEAANALKDQLKQGKNVESLLKQHKWTEVKDLQLDDRTADRYILNAVFQMPLPNQDSPSVDVAQLENNDYAVIWLTNIEKGKAEQATEVEIEQLKTHLLRQNGEIEFTLYTEALKEQAKISKEEFTS